MRLIILGIILFFGSIILAQEIYDDCANNFCYVSWFDCKYGVKCDYWFLGWRCRNIGNGTCSGEGWGLCYHLCYGWGCYGGRTCYGCSVGLCYCVPPVSR